MIKIPSCDKCNGELIFVEIPNSVHYGKEICSNCGKWFRWIKHPEKINQRTKTSRYSINQILEAKGYKEPFCFFCLRTKEQLGFNETLTIDHIVELDKGGTDNIWNLQILCIACHKLKNWIRLYFNWHFEKEDDTSTTSKTRL